MKSNDRFQIYRNVKDSFLLYWGIYGGWKALLKSPYLHLSVITSIACFPIWLKPENTFWYDLPLSALPDLLGFTLGGYAILLAFGNEQFLMILCIKDEEESSPFINVNGAFVHFIVVQAFSLFISIISFCWKIKTGLFAFMGFSIFLYSLLTGVAAAFSLLRIGKWYDIFLAKKYQEKKQGNNSLHQTARSATELTRQVHDGASDHDCSDRSIK
jgi:hypothetical protein